MRRQSDVALEHDVARCGACGAVRVHDLEVSLSLPLSLSIYIYIYTYVYIVRLYGSTQLYVYDCTCRYVHL